MTFEEDNRTNATTYTATFCCLGKLTIVLFKTYDQIEL